MYVIQLGASVISNSDPYCDEPYAAQLAKDWGASVERVGPLGHINAESGLGRWPQALAWIEKFRKQ